MTIIMPTAVEATPGSGPPDTDDNNSNTNNNKNNNANNTGGTGQSRSRKTRSFTEPARKKEEALEKAIKKKAALLEAAKALGEKKKNKAEEESREAMKKDFQEMTATDILHNLEEDIDDDSNVDRHNTSYDAWDAGSVEEEERPKPSTSHTLHPWESLIIKKYF